MNPESLGVPLAAVIVSLATLVFSAITVRSRAPRSLRDTMQELVEAQKLRIDHLKEDLERSEETCKRQLKELAHGLNLEMERQRVAHDQEIAQLRADFKLRGPET